MECPERAGQEWSALVCPLPVFSGDVQLASATEKCLVESGPFLKSGTEFGPGYCADSEIAQKQKQIILKNPKEIFSKSEMKR